MRGGRRFTDRTDAGERLATALREREIDADIVLAIPRGGLPLGRAVADALDVPLDIVVAKKIGAPGNPEYAIGAVASDGSVWRNERAFRATDSDDEYFEEEREVEAENAREKADRYRGERSEPDLTDKTVVVVDDGVATGSTVRACLKRLQGTDAERIVLAVPVGPPDTIDELATEADEVVSLETPTGFRGVGQFYENFAQVSDEEAMTYLEA
ncbi:phosphoribosyltransferase family protein [Natrinema sp. 1APR25-10V2]|uniref:phosphoribosyltransferase n=1 Tax=Natrinema sp. 1APR25-10V2 TaxID=2951081 RepID=UPI002875BA02|nr:phosphoribosyltransferase family protein [Natrinema sp. 1APR25-10V2]MDS0477142.1 phosphoribosyltransferase [Natrinema sp. 1APR25-10V2]